ncbi:hypothetical protein [Escherichia coli]|uniref:hypothetical protein n=1 Tax=Escherichia coli TaxID=562 RepID=UPI00191A183C|nr:hypothetical protein [Escherichia coli]CAD6037068.1 Uncharacterised protein [Escherichia coli]CAD6099193.1 Uncharacterised protein [Escherichia coli]CAD6176256.1 Uncharacterised protein [Escherichia coli]
MAISNRAGKTKKTKTLYNVLTDAVNYYVNNGWDSEESLVSWCKRLRTVASREAPNDRATRNHLNAIYSRLVVHGGALKDQPPDGPTKVTLDKLKPEFRKELDRRIFASANLIELNRERAIEKTLQRFQGWVTSIPPDGVSEIDKRKGKSLFGKSVQELDFISRRVAIDQGHKLASNVKYLLAVQSGAIAFRWHSNWRRPGYKYRKDHKERDGLIYLLRDSWAVGQGLIKPVNGYYDEITSAGEEVYCSCQALPIYAPQKLPIEFLTEKGKREFNRV